MNIQTYKFNLQNFSYQGGDKISRTAVDLNESQYYCTAKDLNAIAKYLNNLKLSISGITTGYNSNFELISSGIYTEVFKVKSFNQSHTLSGIYINPSRIV